MNRMTMIVIVPMLWLGRTDKPNPKSKTTVHAETTVEGKAGAKTTTDTKEIETEMPDGTKQTQHTETATTKPPAATHLPPMPFHRPAT